jgi:hypothetical protein
MRLRFVNSNRQGHGRLRFGFDDDLDPECRWRVLKPQGAPGQVSEHQDDRTGGNDAMPRIKSRKKHQSKPESKMNGSHLFVTDNVAGIR